MAMLVLLLVTVMMVTTMPAMVVHAGVVATAATINAQFPLCCESASEWEGRARHVFVLLTGTSHDSQFESDIIQKGAS